MPVNYNAPKTSFHLPWFMFDMSNYQLLTSTIIPGDMKDVKDIVLTETPIPGLNYMPINPAGGGNRKISFTIPLIKRNNTVGNVLLLKQVENLRNQAGGFFSLATSNGQFTPTPKVLFSWGTGSLPLVYWVKKADATHKEGWVNELGMPQYSEIEFELWLDESHIMYKAEEIWRKMASLTGMVLNAYDVATSLATGKRAY